MDRTLTHKIEAVLLYDQFAVLAPGIWHKLINEFCAKNGTSFDLTPNVKVPDFFHFQSSDMTIEIDYVSEAVMQGAFENSLASDYTCLMFPDAGQTVNQHQSYVHIVITNGRIDPPNPFIENAEVPPSVIFDAEAFDFAAQLLRWLTIVQISSDLPSAIYWAQCDKLLPPLEYLKLAIDFKNQSLLVHPIPFSMMNEETGMVENGIHTFGANALIGCEIKINCMPLPHEELIACIDHLIGITGVTGLMVPDNHVFGRSEDEEIRVLRKVENDVSIVELVFERCEAFGISKPIEDENDELNDFDLDDPAERAMFEQIQKIRSDEASSSSNNNDPEVGDFEEEFHADESWNGVKNKVDMESLRNLTKSSKDAPVKAEMPPLETEVEASKQPPQQKRLLKKVGGLFSRG